MELSEPCLLTTHGLNSDGYAVRNIDGVPRRLHRLAWVKYTGKPIPKGMMVCHRCDVRACVRESHLFLGTRADNNIDMKNKGRSRQGETHWNSKLTRKQVLAIFASTEREMILAREHGVCPATINNIRHGKVWQWLTKT